MSLRTRWTLVLAAGSAALLMAAACGSNGDSGDGTAGAPAGASAYLDCLREQGIDVSNTMPSGRPNGLPSGRPTDFPSGRPTDFPSGAPGGPGGGGPGGFRPEGVDDATWQKAQEACASVRPTGGPGGNGPGAGGPGGGKREADAAYRNCLADRGVNPQANPNTTDPEVAEAMEACAVLRPNATPTP